MPSTFSKPTTHYGNTFNKDATLLVRPEDVERMLKRLHNLAATMKYGLARAPFKITASDEPNDDGFIIIRIRAYSTKNWEHAGERCAEFLNRNIYASADVRINCAGKPAYFTIGDFVSKGKQSQDCETTFTNKSGNYVIEMDENDSHCYVSLHLPVKDATPEAETKFRDVCGQLQNALDELEEETLFDDLIARLDPEVIAIEERLDREYQQRIEAERRAAELAERRAKFAERAAKEQRKIDEQTLNRFAALKVDEHDTTPCHDRNTTSWATKAGKYLPAPVASQQEKPRAKHVSHRAKPETDAHAAPTSPPRPKGRCKFGENCRRLDCGFEHPETRDVSKLVSKEEYEKRRAEKQQNQPYQGKTACRNGSDCTYYNCKFEHPEDHQEESISIEKKEKEPEPATYAMGEGDFPPLASSSGNEWY